MEAADELPVMEADKEEASIVLATMDVEGAGGYSEEQLHTIMGAALTLGFIFMLLVDQLGGGHTHCTGLSLCI